MLMAPILPAPAAPAPALPLPIKQEVAGTSPDTLAVLPPGASPLVASGGAGPVDLAFGTDSGQASLLSNFSQPEGLGLAPQQVVWPSSVGMDLHGPGPDGLFEMDKGALGDQGGLLRLPEGEGLLLDAAGGDPLDPEVLDSEEKVLTQLQSVPVEEPLDL
uniref:Uncharacterized protein n=2 Tax=Varanus komodoensis TaxID=61221 RepID=A0A8D2LJS7_VARKO